MGNFSQLLLVGLLCGSPDGIAMKQVQVVYPLFQYRYADKQSEQLLFNSKYHSQDIDIQADQLKDFKGFEKKDIYGGYKLILQQETAWIALKNLDLNHVAGFGFSFSNLNEQADGQIEIRLDHEKGAIIGRSDFRKGIPVNLLRDGKRHAIYFLFKAKTGIDKSSVIIQGITIFRK